MRILFLAGMILFGITIYAEEINMKWSSNKHCEACHKEISSKWETSRHSNSHFSKNDLFKKSLEYMVRKNPRLILEEVKVDCAQCHNPRIAKSKMSKEDKVLLLMDMDYKKSEYDKALNAEHMKNGINCIVCHNVDEIHLDKTVGSQGLNSIKFGEQGTMFGPFDDAVSPYHKTQQRSHFTEDKPTLCFACHYGTKNSNGLEVYATGKEYDMFYGSDTSNEEGCKTCHMSKKKKGFASNYSFPGEKPKERMVRAHRFASVDNSNILYDHIDVKSSVEGDQFVINVKNNSPHNIPTGYGLREIILKVKYFDKNDKEVGEGSYVLGAKWADKEGRETIPHMAKSIIKDTRLQGKSSKNYKFSIPKGADHAKFIFSYRLISEKMAQELGITDRFFLKEYIFSERRVQL